MADTKSRLIVFARHPVAGHVKTRLIPALGAEGAAAVYRRLLLRTVRTADAYCRRTDVECEMRVAGGGDAAIVHWLGDSRRYRPQAGEDLGERMANAFAEAFHQDAPAAVLMGSDCPSLTPELLAKAFAALSGNPVVLGPATDGGYYLVGLSRPVPDLFRGPAWGTQTVLRDSLAILERLGIKPVLLPELADLDVPEDLPAWRQITAIEDREPRRVSVVIPAVNEATHLPATLRSAARGQPHEIIVVDGGSTDSTREVARDMTATVWLSAPGRARQMNAGAARATGNALLFLHADTLLPEHWDLPVAAALDRPEVAAGAFRFRLAEPFRGKRLIEWSTHIRSHRFQRPYGDQGLFLRRTLFEELGGFADLPIMEDYEMIRRLRRRGRVITLTTPAVTSGRRWRRLGLVRTTLTNKLIVAGFCLGISPHRLAEWYRRK